MRVTMLRFGGIAGNTYLNAGETHDIPEELALELLSRGWAVKPKVVETTAAAPAENTALRIKAPAPRKAKV